MMASTEAVYHVTISLDGDWCVRKAGAPRASCGFRYREDAIKWAEERAETVYVHDRYGMVEFKLTKD